MSDATSTTTDDPGAIDIEQFAIAHRTYLRIIDTTGLDFDSTRKGKSVSTAVCKHSR